MAASYQGLRSLTTFTVAFIGFFYSGRKVVGIADETKRKQSENINHHHQHEVSV
jgi:hypothetical protein